jgi:hypothetical protein
MSQYMFTAQVDLLLRILPCMMCGQHLTTKFGNIFPNLVVKCYDLIKLILPGQGFCFSTAF